MLLLEISISDEPSFWQLVKIVRGESVHPKRRTPDGRMVAHEGIGVHHTYYFHFLYQQNSIMLHR